MWCHFQAGVRTCGTRLLRKPVTWWTRVTPRSLLTATTTWRRMWACWLSSGWDRERGLGEGGKGGCGHVGWARGETGGEVWEKEGGGGGGEDMGMLAELGVRQGKRYERRRGGKKVDKAELGVKQGERDERRRGGKQGACWLSLGWDRERGVGGGGEGSRGHAGWARVRQGEKDGRRKGGKRMGMLAELRVSRGRGIRNGMEGRMWVCWLCSGWDRGRGIGERGEGTMWACMLSSGWDRGEG